MSPGQEGALRQASADTTVPSESQVHPGEASTDLGQCLSTDTGLWDPRGISGEHTSDTAVLSAAQGLGMSLLRSQPVSSLETGKLLCPLPLRLRTWL